MSVLLRRGVIGLGGIILKLISVICWIGVIVDLCQGVIAEGESIAGRVCEDGSTEMVGIAFRLSWFSLHSVLFTIFDYCKIKLTFKLE